MSVARPSTPQDTGDGRGDERRACASPVPHAQELEAALAARADAAPHGLHRWIVEQASEAIVFADRAGTIRLWNRGAERVFGFAAADALGASLDLIIPDRFRAAHWQAFRQAIDSRELRSADQVRLTRALHKDGRRLYVEMSFQLARDDSGAVIGAFAVARAADRRQAGSEAR